LVILFASRGETMATRDGTRQELRDLAKLAATMPRERPTPPPPPSLQRPLTPSAATLTVPPAVASIPPASLTLPPFQAKKRGRAGVLAVSVVLGLSVAVVGGVTLGRTLARHTPPTVAAAPAPSPAPSPVLAASPVPAVAVTPVAATAVATTPVAATPVAAAAPLPKPAATTPAWRRVGPKPNPKSSLTANIPASTGVKDPLEEAIRKAVAAAPPSTPAP
jgi:hypothetical protein